MSCANDFQHALHRFTREDRRGDPQCVRRGEQFLERAHRLDFSAVINHHAIANIFDVGKQMAAENHGLAAPRQRQNQILHFAAADRVEAGSRFVQDDEIRIIDQRLRQADAALHAFGKFAHRARPRLVQADHFQQLFRAIVALAFAQLKKVSERNRASRANSDSDRDRIPPADNRCAIWSAHGAVNGQRLRYALSWD